MRRSHSPRPTIIFPRKVKSKFVAATPALWEQDVQKIKNKNSKKKGFFKPYRIYIMYTLLHSLLNNCIFSVLERYKSSVVVFCVIETHLTTPIAMQTS